MTLYLRLGGRPAVEAAVSSLLERLGDDPVFMTRNQVALKACPRESLTEFLVFIFAGAPTYEGNSLHEAHGGLVVTGAQLDRFIDHLVSIFSNDGRDTRISIETRFVLERVRQYLLSPTELIQA